MGVDGSHEPAASHYLRQKMPSALHSGVFSFHGARRRAPAFRRGGAGRAHVYLFVIQRSYFGKTGD